MIDAEDPQWSARRQCERSGLARSSLYCESTGTMAENRTLMRLIAEQSGLSPLFLNG
jgi:hypothetical protein